MLEAQQHKSSKRSRNFCLSNGVCASAQVLNQQVAIGSHGEPNVAVTHGPLDSMQVNTLSQHLQSRWCGASRGKSSSTESASVRVSCRRRRTDKSSRRATQTGAEPLGLAAPTHVRWPLTIPALPRAQGEPIQWTGLMRPFTSSEESSFVYLFLFPQAKNPDGETFNARHWS
jgi:hypothetical protein